MLCFLFLLFYGINGNVIPPLDHVFGFCYSQELASSHDAIAWVRTCSGIHNVMISQNFKPPIRLTNFSNDDGLFIEDLTFSVDGDALIFSVSPAGRSNPSNNVNPPTRDIMIANLINSEVTVLVRDAYLLAVSGTGATSSIIYADGTAVYEQFTSSTSPKMLFMVTDGSVTELKLSPDHKKIAFRNHRGDHAFIGIYDGSNHLHYLNPSFDVDDNIAWSHDNQHLAFVRRLNNNTDEFGRHTFDSFSVFVVDTNDKEPPREVYRDFSIGWPTAGAGDKPLVWGDASHLIIPSESTGWLHLISVNINNSVKIDLTPGVCENQDWIVDRNSLFVTHNCDDIDSRGISMINITSGERKNIVKGNKHVVAGMSNSGKGICIFHNDAVIWIETGIKTPPTVMYRLMDGSLAKKLDPDQPTSFDTSQFVTPQNIEFMSTDGKYHLHGQLWVPTGSLSKKPAVLYTHGGPQRQMYSAFHYMDCYAQLYAMNQFLTMNGFVVFSINYRMGIGYGHKFRNCEKCGWKGAAEYGDVLAANKYLANQSFVDAAHIGIYGLSYGGLNTLQALTRNSDVFAAGVAVAPVFNWVSQSRFDGEDRTLYNPSSHGLALPIGPEPDLAGPNWTDAINENIKMAWLSSPVAYVDQLTSPILLIQGDMDEEVAIQESIGLIRALRRRNLAHPPELLMFPDEKHGMARYANQLKAYQQAAIFFKKHLQSLSTAADKMK